MPSLWREVPEMTQLDFIDKTLEIKDPPDFTVVSTFAGCGGSSTGYVWAGGKVLLAIEWDQNAVETYRLNYPTIDIYHGDIKNITGQDVLERIGLEPGQLDILDGSPPCQGFSTAGKRNLEDDRNQLFREYVRLLKVLTPKVFVMENVSGMVKGKMKLLFAEIMRELKASGYKVKAKLLNAMYLGVPQSRQRMIFIGVRDDLGIESSHPKPQSRPKGCVRFDSQSANYSEKRYGDTLEIEGNPIGTITKIGRKFWSRNEEFGRLSYICNASFPKQYHIVGNLSDVKNRIGNSVPPRMMEYIAEHIKTHILEKIAT